jgi:uncharacterized protein
MSIQPVETAVTAFVGRAKSGPVGQPVRIASFGEYEQKFGGLAQDSAMSFAVQAYFQNGGQKALVLRLQPGQGGLFLCRWLRRADGQLQASDYTGPDLAARQKGLYALLNAPYFGLLVLPEDIPGGMPAEVVAAAVEICEARGAFLLLDPPPAWDTVQAAAAGASALGAHSPNAAVFFPRLRMANPLKNGAVEAVGPSGAVAGLLARLDAAQGVWKAPAGVEANLVGAPELSLNLTQRDFELLVPKRVNPLRVLPDGKTVLWGSRTLAEDSADAGSKYIPSRRTVLFIEESLLQGMQWAVNEPNNEGLWSEARKQVGDFLFNLFQKGALQGNKPEQAFFVRCDRSTMTQEDIASGRLEVLVGVALLKPAEFEIVRIQVMVRGG